MMSDQAGPSRSVLSPTNVQSVPGDTRPLLDPSLSSPSSPSPVPAQPDNGKGCSAITRNEGNSEGVFHPKGPDLEELSLQTEPLPFESDVKASIVHFHTAANYFVRGTPTIRELLYQDTPAKYMEHLIDNNQTVNPDLRWIHLPANNMSWVESIVNRIYSEEPMTTEAEMDATPQKTPASGMARQVERKASVPFDMIYRNAEVVKDQGDVFKSTFKSKLLLRSELWEQRQWQDPVLQKSAQGRFLRPLYAKTSYARVLTDEQKLVDHEGLFSMEDAKTNSVMFIPYIHWEEIDMYLLRNKCLKWMVDKGKREKTPGLDKNVKGKIPFDAIEWKRARSDTTVAWDRKKMQKYPHSIGKLMNDAKLLFAYIHEAKPLHVRRTLDQSYYYPLPDEDIRKRDLDQVLFRYTNTVMHLKEKSRILMVDQLWMWIIDEPGRTKTVLTAFPPRWMANPAVAREDITDIYNRIFRALCTGAAVTSLTDLTCLIVDKCSSLFHPRVDEVDQTLDSLEVFAVSIGGLADAQTKQANEISMHSRRLVALQNEKEKLYQASLRERLFKKSRLGSDTTEGTASRRQREAPEKDVKATAGDPAQPLSREDQEAAEYFEDKQDLNPYDPLEGLSEILGMGNKLEIDSEIEKELNALVNITAESDSLKEIKDILDELNSISHVFQQQLKIVSEIVASYAPSRSTSHSNDPDSRSCQRLAKNDEDDDWSKGKESTTSRGLDRDDEAKQDTAEDEDDDLSKGKESTRSRGLDRDNEAKQDAAEDVWHKYDQLLSTLRRREQDISNMKVEADRVYHAICDLLDLKQKQASVSEAYSARQEAKESARQGQTILLFTVVTIIFLPLSFIAAVYSMNATEINGNSRPIRHIYTIMFPTTIGVLLISLIFAYNAYIWWFLVGLVTWNRKRRARKEQSAGKAPTETMTTKSGAGGDQKRTDTTMSGALPPEMHDGSAEKGGSDTGLLVNWIRKHALRWRQGRKNQETKDEESNGGKTTIPRTERRARKDETRKA